MTAWAEPAAEPAWIYALPGSSLVPGLPAGAPPLEALDHQAGPWRALLLYGPPPLALASLARNEQTLDDWRRQLQLAGQLKRRHRQRLTLLNTATLSAEAAADLQRQWPELQPGSNGAEPPPWPSALLTLAAQTVLRLDPALRAACLDLEAEADGADDETTATWRHDPSADDWLLLLRQWGGSAGSPGSPSRPGASPSEQSRQLRRQGEWLQLLSDHEAQLEHELASHLATAQAMAGLLPLLEAQLARARRALEQTP
ncbi:MAG: hypothetical protein ACOYMY_04915 [Prochlorococcaceae cyanobacterium]